MVSVLRFPFIISVLVLSLATAALSFFVTKPNSDTIDWDEREQNWKEVELFYDSPKQSNKNVVIDGSLWGLVVSQKESDSRVEWAVKAIVDENDKRFFIAHISPEDRKRKEQTFLRFSLNDSLPDGGVVKKITKDSVVYELDGKKVEKHLYETTSSHSEKRS